jgi:hypothetical protein
VDRNRPGDLNELAARIVAEATGEAERTDPPFDGDDAPEDDPS